MSRLSWLQKLYWTHLGKPVSDRELYRFLLNSPIASILEIGMGNCQRIRRLAPLVQPAEGVESIRYIGTDEFEAAADSRGHLSLKQAHQVAGALGFKASLIPGDVAGAIPRVAQKLGASDLIIVDGGLDPNRPMDGFLASWWNRLAHEGTTIFASSEVGQELKRVEPSLLEQQVSKAA